VTEGLKQDAFDVVKAMLLIFCCPVKFPIGSAGTDTRSQEDANNSESRFHPRACSIWG
jgi:hypothetical protein